MKGKVLFAALFCLFGFTQVSGQVTFKPGVKAGLNLSKLTNIESDFRPDFYVGGLVEIKFADFYALQPEIVYSRQGGTVKYIDFNDEIGPTRSYEKKYSLDYLSLGAINKFTFAKSFQAVVGPTLDFQLADNFESSVSDELIGVDLGLVLGVGYSLPNGITFEARFKQGLVDIFGDNYNNYDNYDDNGNIDDVILNQVFQFGVSYTFGNK